MIYYIDTNNKLFVFEDNVTDEIIQRVEKIHNTKLTRITEQEYLQLIAPTLDQIKQAKISEINSKAKQEIISGFISNALGTTHLYQSKEVDQLNLIGLVSAGQDDYFKCSADGGSTWKYKLHTIDQLKQVLADGKKKKLEILIKAGSLKEKVINATTKEEVEAIVW